jgi:hypothetical protein
MSTAAEIAERLHAKRTGKEWLARCPAHDDRHPSLSIAEGDDGKVLLLCRSGCKAEAVCAAGGGVDCLQVGAECGDQGTAYLRPGARPLSSAARGGPPHSPGPGLRGRRTVPRRCEQQGAMVTTPAYMRPADLAQRFSVSERTIRDWQRRGIIPFYKPSKKVTLFCVAEVEKALRRFRHVAVGGTE